MTAGTNTNDDLRCHRCAHHARPGERFCERCGAPLETASGPTRSKGGGTTRYLCAAAHLDQRFCDEAIAEYLVEPMRAIPPSPGVDSAAVLREAVAAQLRRRIRDGFVLAFLLALVLLNVTFVLSWIGVAVIVVVLRAFSTRRRRRPPAWLIIAFGAPSLLLALLQGSAVRQELGESSPLSSIFPAALWPTVLIGALLLVVLAVDAFTVAKLMGSSFRLDRFDPDASRAPSAWERIVRSLGRNSFRTELQRIARSEESSQPANLADVIVYRGHRPFIGAGEQVRHQVIALPLEPSEDDGDTAPIPISVNDLHRHVAEALAKLRSASSLGPGRRLEQLRLREQVLIPADRLLFNRSTQMRPPVLLDLFHPPLAHLPLGAARALAEDPLEWARYYSCFRIESWDRDLTTSCYLHFGTDQHMLYLERTYCTLFPVSERCRSVDEPADSPWRTFGYSLVELIMLPASLLARLRSVFRRNKMLVQRPGELLPARYGAAQSIRELAADTKTQTYFQDADTERYINIMDRVIFRAVGKFLEKRGYSVVEFTKMADPVINNYNVQGNVTNSLIGSGNRNVQMAAAPAAGGTTEAK